MPHLRGGHWPSSALHPSGGRSAPPTPGGFCGTVVPAPTSRRSALHPGDFLAKRKSPKIRQGPPGPWTPSEGGGSKSVPLLLLPPLIPRPSALAVLVAIAQTLKHPRRHPLPRHGLTAEGVTPGVAWGEKKTDLPTNSKWQIGLLLWQKVARREPERSAASAKRAVRDGYSFYSNRVCVPSLEPDCVRFPKFC